MALRKKVFEFELAQQSTPDHRLIYGNPEARITLQEFGDIECPFCRKMHDDLKQVVDNAENTVNWEFKHFPLESHNPAAALQAKVIECVKDSYGNKVAWAALDRSFSRLPETVRGLETLRILYEVWALAASQSTCAWRRAPTRIALRVTIGKDRRLE
jgi:thiol-disulfide isomerase/thioredoxin